MKLIPVGKQHFAMVDDADYNELSKYTWYLRRNKNKDLFYAFRSICLGNNKFKQVMMHRILLPEYKMIDHKDGNGLNNQRINLRECTRSGNAKNSKPRGISKYKGVSWHIPTNKWLSHIKIGKKYKHLGLYENEVDAAKAYDNAALATGDPFYRINKY